MQRSVFGLQALHLRIQPLALCTKEKGRGLDRFHTHDHVTLMCQRTHTSPPDHSDLHTYELLDYLSREPWAECSGMVQHAAGHTLPPETAEKHIQKINE